MKANNYHVYSPFTSEIYAKRDRERASKGQSSGKKLQ